MDRLEYSLKHHYSQPCAPVRVRAQALVSVCFPNVYICVGCKYVCERSFVVCYGTYVSLNYLKLIAVCVLSLFN